jgi:hypothetical protein
MRHRARSSCTLLAASCCTALACAADPGDPLKTLAAYRGSSDSGSSGGEASSNGSSTGSSGGSAASSGSGSGSGASGSGSGGSLDANGEASSNGSRGGSSGAMLDAAIDTYTPPSCPTCPLEVEYFAKDPADAGPVQAISFDIAIANSGSMTRLLSELTARYWFMGQNDVSNLKMECYYAKIGCQLALPDGGSQNNIGGTFMGLATTFPKADTYLEISFSASAGSIAPNGDTGDIQIAIHSNYSGPTRFIEDNDYSFDPRKTVSTCKATQGAPSCPWDHITLYRQGTLVWGIEPGGNMAGGDAGAAPDGAADATGN